MCNVKGVAVMNPQISIAGLSYGKWTLFMYSKAFDR